MAKEAPYVTRAELDRYVQIDAERKRLNREADLLKAQQEELGNKLRQFCRVQGGDALSVERSGYRLSISHVKGSVAWKQEFVRVAGVEAAERIAIAAPLREQLECVAL